MFYEGVHVSLLLTKLKKCNLYGHKLALNLQKKKSFTFITETRRVWHTWFLFVIVIKMKTCAKHVFFTMKNGTVQQSRRNLNAIFGRF